MSIGWRLPTTDWGHITRDLVRDICMESATRSAPFRTFVTLCVMLCDEMPGELVCPSCPHPTDCIASRQRCKRSGQYFNYHRGAYIDNSKPARACLYCERSYCGPALYCSMDCAVLDA